MTTGKMMALPNTSATVVQKTDGGLLYDPNAGFIYGVAQTGGALNGIRKWNAYPTGSEVRARNAADMGVSSTVFYPVACFAYASQQIVISGGAANSQALFAFTMQDMTPCGGFGVTNSSLAPSDAGRILATNYMVSFLDAKGRDVVVCAPITAASEINCIQWGKKYNQSSAIAEPHSVLAANPDGSGSNAWALGIPAVSTGTMHLYRIGPVVGGNGIQATVGAITPANIDATWTHVSVVFGMALDQKDGNLLCGFQTTDAVATTNYLVKINSATAAIMWKIPVPEGFSYSVDRGAMRFSVIKNGKFYLSAGIILYIVDTIAGTADKSISLDTGGPANINGTQISEDVSGSIMWYGGWTEVGLHPEYIGASGLTGGSEMVWRFWPALGGVFTAPSYSAVGTSRKRAWTFTLDGHTFYVLDLGQEGTFVWDKTTKQWAQFITQGYTAWNFCNGCMWGQRIIAGDQLTTDIWEMLPGSSLFDNGATEIVHVVTGGVATRSRIYHSVDSFRLACSAGKVLDAAGANVTLSFSDDQGNTWTAMDTLNLPQGNFGQEIAWIGLGAFSAPGRIFKITDSGGFLRIDGADAGIDSFDNEPGS